MEGCELSFAGDVGSGVGGRGTAVFAAPAGAAGAGRSVLDELVGRIHHSVANSEDLTPNMLSEHVRTTVSRGQAPEISASAHTLAINPAVATAGLQLAYDAAAHVPGNTWPYYRSSPAHRAHLVRVRRAPMRRPPRVHPPKQACAEWSQTSSTRGKEHCRRLRPRPRPTAAA